MTTTDNIKYDSDSDLFSTPDIALASTLLCLKFVMLRVDYQIEGDRRSPKGYFCFDNSAELQEAYNKYWQGKLAIEPKEYELNRKGLLAQVNNTYKSPNSQFNRS